MASLRKVRKDFRKEVLRLIKAGDGNIETLINCAGNHFGHDVGYEKVLTTFLQTEVSNAVSSLRTEGFIETIGRKWKASDELEAEDVSIISNRRLKRLRGELEAQIRLDHEHGLVEEASKVGMLLQGVKSMLAVEDEAATEAAKSRA